ASLRRLEFLPCPQTYRTAAWTISVTVSRCACGVPASVPPHARPGACDSRGLAGATAGASQVHRLLSAGAEGGSMISFESTSLAVHHVSRWTLDAAIAELKAAVWTLDRAALHDGGEVPADLASELQDRFRALCLLLNEHLGDS